MYTNFEQQTQLILFWEWLISQSLMLCWFFSRRACLKLDKKMLTQFIMFNVLESETKPPNCHSHLIYFIWLPELSDNIISLLFLCVWIMPHFLWISLLPHTMDCMPAISTIPYDLENKKLWWIYGSGWQRCKFYGTTNQIKVKLFHTKR